MIGRISVNSAIAPRVTSLLVALAALLTGAAPAIDKLADCNVVWDARSTDESFSSMPLGNGDVGLDVWVETNGDLMFYVAKVDAFDAQHLLPKLGRIRLRTDPVLEATNLKTTLLLEQAAVEGVGCAETYQGVTNPATEMGCMKYLLDLLLSFPIDAQRRATFAKWRAMLPDVPTRRIRGMDLLAVGEVYDPGRVDCETPELYSIYPFRQAWLGTPQKLAMARQSFHVRNSSLDGTVDWQPVETGGWQSAPVQAAHLGLAREAARLASINFHDRFAHWTGNIVKGPNGELMRGTYDSPGFVVGDPKSGLPFPYRPRAKFPAFWETKMDGTPDNDHGANSVNTLQAMLLQSDGDKIHLLPAWPEDWDVSFKLATAKNTTVEGVYQNGRITALKVTPESRRKDIINHSAPEARIRTLIEIACTDRNWLFNLPPMLDGLPTPGPVTGPWIEKFGESVTNTRGTFWPGCTFRDHVLYVHGKNPVPQLPAKVLKQTALSDTLVKIEYDQPLEAIVRAGISAGSLTAGKSGTTIDLGEARTFDRLEFTIEHPNYLRGQAKSFRLEVLQPDGQWRIVHHGKIYGIIYSKRFPAVTASQVRLAIDAPITQFDLFPPGRVTGGSDGSW